MKLHHRTELVAGLCDLALFSCLGIWAYRTDPGSRLWIFLLTVGLCLAAFFLYRGTMTETLTEEGILVKTLLRTQKVPWSKVERAGIVRLKLGPSAEKYISVTWQAENNRKTWVQRWLWWMKLDNRPGFLFPYSDELRAVVTEYYGPLDLDLRDRKGDADERENQKEA